MIESVKQIMMSENDEKIIRSYLKNYTNKAKDLDDLAKISDQLHSIIHFLVLNRINQIGGDNGGEKRDNI